MAPEISTEYDDLDYYGLDDIDDPFGTPPLEGQGANEASAQKRKQGEVLGLDEEIEVAKRVRVPRVKLDEARLVLQKLLSENGIPKLRQRAGDLKFKGKGHEFSDAARLLSFYQLWLDDLFPKAKFLDALAMVERTGHKKIVAHKRLEWINQGKPKSWEADDILEENVDPPAPESDQRTAALTAIKPVTAKDAPRLTTEQLPTTPEGDIPDEADIYGATPLAQVRSQGPVDEEDDLDALMAESEAATQRQPRPQAHQETKNLAEDDFADEEAAMAAMAEMDGLW